MDPQTYWNSNMLDFETFKLWVGDDNAESKIYMAKYLKDKNYQTLVDAGCGNTTFNDTLKNNKINIKYTGADSCVKFINDYRMRGIDMLETDIRNFKNTPDSAYDCAFSRHTFEHQPDYKIILNELIRIAKMETCHIFFIKPTLEAEQIIYTKHLDLYHNKYCITDIEETLKQNSKVLNWEWVNINNQECALHIYLKY